jgi:hypothetical protein
MLEDELFGNEVKIVPYRLRIRLFIILLTKEKEIGTIRGRKVGMDLMLITLDGMLDLYRHFFFLIPKKHY